MRKLHNTHQVAEAGHILNSQIAWEWEASFKSQVRGKMRKSVKEGCSGRKRQITKNLRHRGMWIK